MALPGNQAANRENKRQSVDYRPMIYVFCDEDKKHSGSGDLFRYAAVAFNQGCYNRLGEGRIRELLTGGTSFNQRMIEILKNNNGIALLTEAQIPKDFLSAGEVICTPDIPKMALLDYLWSISMVFTIGCLFPILTKKRWSYKTVDVYYDPKSMTDIHRNKILEYLQQRLKRQVKDFRRKMNQESKFNIRRVKEIPKPKSRTQFDKFQIGVWLADRLVRKYDHLASIDDTDVIEFMDITDHCLNIFSKHVIHTNNLEGNGLIG